MIKSAAIRKLQEAIDTLRGTDTVKTFAAALDTSRAGPISGKIETIPRSPGIYLFWMTNPNDWDTFLIGWQDANVPNSPKLIQSRVDHWRASHSSEWIPLYLGKTLNLRSRINQHVYHDRGKATYSLKLSARTKSTVETLRLSYVTVEPTRDIATILSVVERELRIHTFLPIVGRQ